MHSARHELALDDEEGAGPGHLLAAPGAGLRWTPPGRPRTLRRTWLDTFDWRLYRAGLTLLQVSSAGGTEIAVTGRGGEVLAAGPGGPGPRSERAGGEPRGRQRWPGPAARLPPGPLRDLVAPVAGARALLPVARARSTVTTRRVLDADDKTVAWVTEDLMCAGPAAPGGLAARYPPAGGSPGGTTLPARLSVTAMRGYQRQAAAFARMLAAAPGVAAGPCPALGAVLAAAGRHPGDYSGKVEVALAARMPASAAMAEVLTALLDLIEANVPGTLRDTDTEFLHDLRIAVRRSRTALKLASGALPAGVAGRFRPELKWLGDLTAGARDLDVYLLGFPEMAAGLVAATPADLQPFRDHLARRRAAALRQLARGLRSARFSRFTAEWRACLAGPAAAGGCRTAGRLAATRIARAHDRVLADGAALTAASAPESLHELRKRCKELRYLLEIFGSLYDPAGHRRVVRDIKGLQDCLGEYQDTQVQREEIRDFAEQMLAERAAPAATLLAMGEIMAGLAARQRRAREEFRAAFSDFASPPSRSRVRALTGAAAG